MCYISGGGHRTTGQQRPVRLTRDFKQLQERGIIQDGGREYFPTTPSGWYWDPAVNDTEQLEWAVL
jgi:hypothetical protein